MDVARALHGSRDLPTTAEAQERHAGNLMRVAADKVRLLPGFLRARVLVPEDGERAW